MKSLLISIALLLGHITCMKGQVPTAPTTSENHIMVRKARIPAHSEAAFLNLNEPKHVAEDISYFDGLGRPIQSIAVHASPEAADMVSFQQYDEFGRSPIQFQPYIQGHTGGQFRGNSALEHAGFYSQQNFPHIPIQDLSKAYSESVFENTPFSRVIEQGAPGEAWQIEKINGQSTGQGHTIKVHERVNTTQAHDLVFRWQHHAASGHYFASTVYAPQGSGHTIAVWPAGSLSVKETTDENGNLSLSYSDKLGRIVLSRQLFGDYTTAGYWAFASTYYLYNDIGQLTHVVQPEAVSQANMADHAYVLDDELLDDFVFQYQYDAKQRLMGKKVPGAGWTYMAYDLLDRPILTQTALQRAQDQWSFSKFDALGRPILTGIYWSAATQATMQQILNSWTGPLFESPSPVLNSHCNNLDYQDIGYTDAAFPKIIKDICFGGSNPFPTDLYTGEIHSITYYDDYDFNANGQADCAPTFFAGMTIEPAHLLGNQYHATGKVTGIKVRILDPEPDMPDWLRTVTFYDKYGREIQTLSDTHLPDGNGGFSQDLLTNAYNFAGDMERQLIHHQFNLGSAGWTKIDKSFSYDHRSRIEQVKVTVNNDPEVILSAMEYDELGQLIEKNLHSTNQGANFLQSIDYYHNIRGWLQDINDVDAPMAQASCNPSGGGTSNNGVSLGHVAIEFSKIPTGNGGEVFLEASMYMNEEVEIVEGRNGQTITLENIGSVLKRSMIPSHSNFTTPSTIVHDFSGQEVTVSNIFSFEATLDSLIMDGTNGSGMATADRLAFSDMSVDMFRHDMGSILEPDDQQDLFAEHLLYQQDDGHMHTKAKAQYNGNIRSMHIRTANSCLIRRWDYQYDKLNRLTNAHYKAQDANATTTTWNQELGRYTTQQIQYDLNGNILGLQRFGKQQNMVYGAIDELQYSYSGNQLIAVEDLVTTAIDPTITHFVDSWTATVDPAVPATHEYQYDPSGNLSLDRNKGLQAIAYNHLNKPTLVQKSPTELIRYIYSADGTKLRQVVSDNGNITKTDYSNGFHYKVDLSGRTLDFISHEEGRFMPDGGSFSFEYTLSDHLGNSRVCFKEAPAHPGKPLLIQETQYYAFGMEISDLGWRSGSLNRFLYNGKELQDELNLGIYNFYWREYDPVIARWWQVDPFDQYASPYLAMGNNPVNGIDPDGGWFWEAKHVRHARQRYREHKKAGRDASFDKVKEKGGGTVAKVVAFGKDGTYGGNYRKGDVANNNSGSNFVENTLAGTIAIILGAGNAFSSDFLLGAGRYNPNDLSFGEGVKDAFAFGQLIGDAGAAVVGAVESVSGAILAAGGGVVTVATAGIASPISVPATALGAGMAAHGGVSSATAVSNLVNNRLFAKGGKFKGGKKNKRDQGMSGRPADFKKWFHRERKQKGDPDSTPSEIEDALQEWIDLGRPGPN